MSDDERYPTGAMRGGPKPFPPLAPGHPAIWEPCALCDKTFIAGDVTTLVPKEKWKPGSSMTVEGALVHQSCYEIAMRAMREDKDSR